MINIYKNNESATHYIVDYANNMRSFDVKTNSSNHELFFLAI